MYRFTNDKINIALLSLISCILLGSLLFGSTIKDTFFIKPPNKHHKTHHKKHHTHKILKKSKP
jgi:hypothetical protein